MEKKRAAIATKTNTGKKQNARSKGKESGAARQGAQDIAQPEPRGTAGCSALGFVFLATDESQGRRLCQSIKDSRDVGGWKRRAANFPLSCVLQAHRE